MSTKLSLVITNHLTGAFETVTLETISANSIDELIVKTVNALVLLKNKEHEAEIKEIKEMAGADDIPF